jgi:hypothetical protein
LKGITKTSKPLSTETFYSNLPFYDISLSALLDDGAHFTEVPDDWHVIITDIKNSTQAIARGQHETINLIATGSIIAVLNIANKQSIEIPFFFGGDGSALIIPPGILDIAMGSLITHQKNVRQNFNLELRIGSIPVSEIYQSDHVLQMAKLKVDTAFAIPVVYGNGLSFAEMKVKKEDYLFSQEIDNIMDLDLTGMECRWDRIRPAEKDNEVVSLLVSFCDEKDALRPYKKVIDSIDSIYGPRQKRNPVNQQHLKLKSSFNKISSETRVKFGYMKWWYLVKTFFETLYGKLFYFTFDDQGIHYLTRLVQLSDTLVLDGKINTVISGTPHQRTLLTDILNKLENQGDILFGLHVSNESIMSCYVRDRSDHHIHFIDGADGGYTGAAKQLKIKIKNRLE